MNTPRDLGPDFRSWLRDVPAPPPELATRTLDQTRHTRQRRRRLWFLPGPTPTTGADDHRGPARSTPTTDVPSGGTTITMFSPAKMVAAATALALTGALLLAGPFTTPAQPPPAAPAYEPGVITPVEGTMRVRTQPRAGDIGTYAGGTSSLDEWWETEYEVSDPRLNGVAVSRHNRNLPVDSTSHGGARTITIRLDNDGGTWVGTGRAYSDPRSGIHYQVHLTGQGGYEGLDAIIALDNESASAPFEVSGAIISGGLPEMPEEVPATAE